MAKRVLYECTSCDKANVALRFQMIHFIQRPCLVFFMFVSNVYEGYSRGTYHSEVMYYNNFGYIQSLSFTIT